MSARFSNKDDVTLLAQVLSGGDETIISAVRTWTRDPPAYFRSHKTNFSYDSPDNMSPFWVVYDLLIKNKFIGSIDWRCEPEGLIEEMRTLLRRHGIDDFDWSFIQRLEEDENWEMLKNMNLLNLARDRIRDRGKVLFAMFIPWDQHQFGIVGTGDFEKIRHMVYLDFEISDSFA